MPTAPFVAGVARTALLLAFVYVCYALLVFAMQRTIIYPGRVIAVDDTPPVPSPDGQVIWLETAAGKVESWLIPAQGLAKGAQAPLLLFFHGNGEVIDFLPGQVNSLSRLGIHVLLVEYPGYGRSGGTPSESSITAAAVAAYDALVSRPDIDPSRIIAFGRSIGGGPATALSMKRPLAALVLQSSFTSLRPFARQFLVPGFLVRDAFDNLPAVRNFSGPMLIAHGRRDDIIPFPHGLALAKAGRNVRFIEFDCAHNDCPPDLDAFWKTVAGFLKDHKIL